MRLSVPSLGRRYQHHVTAPIEEDFEPLLTLDAEQTGDEAALNNSKPEQGSPTSSNESTEMKSVINLLVLKLDGSSFNVSVRGASTVGEMKTVLERTVNELEMKMLGYCDIQWEQVWGNFCLCYMNQKLLDEKASLRAFGIHDDDQIHFLRHRTDGRVLQTKRRSSA